MELQAVTALLQVVNGDVQQQANVPGLLASPAPSSANRSRQRDFLFVHLTLTGPEAETATLLQDLMDSLSGLFYETSGSVTAALRKAIGETNKRLLSLNLSGSSQVREGALLCAVLREQELYMAQVGESFALLGHNFGIERLPPNEPKEPTPFGRTAGLDIRYYHHWLQPGDMLLLADPRLAHLQTQAFDPVLIDSDVEDAIPQLVEMIGSGSARLMLVEFAEEAPAYVPDIARPAIASGARRLTPPTGEPQREPVALSEATDSPPLQPTSTGLEVEAIETSARRATSRAARGLAGLTGWLADLMSAIKAPTSEEEERTGWAIPGFIAVAIPIIVAVVVTGVYLQRGRVVRFGELKQQMSQNLNLAQQATDSPELAIDHYQQVIQLAIESETLRPGDGDINRMRRDAQLAIDELNGVARLEAAQLYQYPSEVDLQSITLGDELNGDVFVRDAAGNRVYRHQTDSSFEVDGEQEPELVLFDEQVVGSHVVEQIDDMMWRAKGASVTRDGLAMLDRAGALVTFYPNFADTRAVPLGLASDWVFPDAIADFNERLYILDPGAEKIWRYFAEGDGFTMNEEQRFIEFVDDPDLGNAVDFAIYSEDGSVVILYADGRIRRYVNGRLLWGEGELSANGLEQPFVSPVAAVIAGRGLNSSIFIADPGSDRIVQLSLGGTFLAQYKASDSAGRELFSSLQDFAALENPLRIFVATRDGLYLATQ